MKKLYLFILTLFTVSFIDAQTYVNEAATGANNGSSWTDAYTDLSLALSSGAPEIWIAAGTYKPGSGSADTLASFMIDNTVTIYGGFAGVESSPADRNIEDNRTILSGDHADNDNPGDVYANKSDNALHIMFISDVAGTVTLDGIDFKGGAADLVTNNNPETQWRGGAIFSYATLDIRNSRFYENTARAGSGVYISFEGNGGAGSSFTNCEFFNSAVTSQSAGIFINDKDDITVTGCKFYDNDCVRGAFYPLRCDNVTVTNSSFDRNRNTTTTTSGGAVFSFGSTNLQFNNCKFSENLAGSGGAIYTSADTMPDGSLIVEFTDCTFENNEANNFGGGAYYNWQGSFNMTNCTFINNRSSNSGSQFFSNGINENININNCTFTGGATNFAAGHTCYGENANYNITNCTYTDGIANTSGGAMVIGFKAIAMIENCTFENNSARFGGAFNMQNDTTKCTVINSTFTNNTAEQNLGGAINHGAGPQLTVQNCVFLGNLANIGGAISATNDRGGLTITNSIFDRNRAFSQGGGVNLFDNTATLSSNLFIGNVNEGVSGGAISNNAGDSTTAELTLVNNTFYDNEAGTGATLGQFTTDLSSEANTTLQNNVMVIFEGDNYAVEAGTPKVISNGGNISSDSSLDNVLTNTNDLNNIEEPGWVDPDDDKFTPAQGSAMVNTGIENGTPLTDILGNPRVGAPDIGAFELQDPSSINSIIPNEGTLVASPNPASDFTLLTLDDEWIGRVEILVTDISGKIYTRILDGTLNNGLEFRLDVAELESGVYSIIVKNDYESITTRFIKVK